MSERKHINKMPGSSFLLALPFFLVLAVLTVVSFLVPLRPTFSNSEKRELTSFPEFSVSSLVSGEYFDEITLWFSDTFPGREDWLTVSQYTTNFHGYSEIAFEGPLTVSDQIPMETIPPATKPAPPAPSEEPEAPLPSEAETEPAEETTPEASEDSPAEPEVPEETQAWGGDEVDINEIALGTAIQIGDTGYNQLGFSKIHSDRYINAVSTFADAMAEKGVRVISAPAPTSVGVMIEEAYLAQLGCAPQDDMLAYLHDSMSDNVIKVDTFSNMVKHNNEYIYFRTDHHWTQLGAYYAYEALCNTLGYEAISLDDCRLWTQGEFTGSLYGKVRWPSRLRVDILDAYVPQGDIVMYCYFRGSTIGKEWPLIDDRTGDDKNGRYSCFLGSDAPMVHVINNDIPDAPSCIVMKDSFGNCYVPFLTQHYSNIYALDYRTYKNMSIAAFVDQYDIDDVIIAPYMIATQSEDGSNMFARRLQIP